MTTIRAILLTKGLRSRHIDFFLLHLLPSGFSFLIMEARYLRKEELLWELRFRGVAAFLGEEGQAKTVAEMEAALTPMIASERDCR